jgi:hypothetical protein
MRPNHTKTPKISPWLQSAAHLLIGYFLYNYGTCSSRYSKFFKREKNQVKELKTKETEQSVEAFLNSIEDEKKRQDSFVILDLMKQVTGLEPKMWGSSMVGFGRYHYKYASGHEGDAYLTGFSPRKQNLTIYIMPGFEHYDELMQKLGKYKTGKSCLYVNKIENIDLEILKELVKQSVELMKETYS